jgi:hypothetical protein
VFLPHVGQSICQFGMKDGAYVAGLGSWASAAGQPTWSLTSESRWLARACSPAHPLKILSDVLCPDPANPQGGVQQTFTNVSELRLLTAAL